MSQSELRISWLPPDYPNGDVINYNVVVDDDVTIDVGLEQSHVLDDLQPYKLVVCWLELVLFLNTVLITVYKKYHELMAKALSKKKTLYNYLLSLTVITLLKNIRNPH